MFKRNWINGFAFGVVAGFLLTPALIIAAILFGVSPGDFGQSNNQPNGGEQAGPKDDRWWLIRRVVYMDDTAAQWVMMFATIFAAYLLLRTLWATQKMAADTREIGEAQVRPWLSIDMQVGSDLVFHDDNARIVILATVQNFGYSPAIGVSVNVEIVANVEDARSKFEEHRNRPVSMKKVRRDYGHQLFPRQLYQHHVSTPIPLTKQNYEEGMIAPTVMCFITYYSATSTEKPFRTEIGMQLVDTESGMGLGISTDAPKIDQRRLELQRGFGKGTVE